MPKMSGNGAAFVGGHEGFVSRAYLCPAGVLTIGYGFTMRSRVFASWWKAKYGRALQKGDTISRADADFLLIRVFDEEYGAAVNAKIGTQRQHEYDGAGSMTFNCGVGALNWVWAKLLKAGDVSGSAKRLKTTAVTANGRKLAGLVRRRREEAALIEHGDYGQIRASVPASVSRRYSEVRAYQKQLIGLGYDLGPAGADGTAGPKTIAAVKKFQIDHGLVSDGIVGPATRATLIRAVDAKNSGKALAAGPVAGVGGGGAAETVSQSSDVLTSAIMWGVGALVLVAIAVFLLRYRGVLTGRRVPT